jgi:hypothetical protein
MIMVSELGLKKEWAKSWTLHPLSVLIEPDRRLSILKIVSFFTRIKMPALHYHLMYFCKSASKGLSLKQSMHLKKQSKKLIFSSHIFY